MSQTLSPHISVGLTFTLTPASKMMQTGFPTRGRDSRAGSVSTYLSPYINVFVLDRATLTLFRSHITMNFNVLVLQCSVNMKVEASEPTAETPPPVPSAYADCVTYTLTSTSPLLKRKER